MQDNSFALEVLRGKDINTSSVFPQKSSRLCESCKQLDVWAQNFVIRDTWANLEKTAQICDFHTILLQACASQKDNLDTNESATIEVRRIESSLMVEGIDKAVLSICRTPGMCQSSSR